MLRFLLVLFIFIIAGCSTMKSLVEGYEITYDSHPSGASLMCDGQFKGYTPTTLYYDVTIQDIRGGLYKTTQCKTVWVSGASVAYKTEWDLKEFPNGVTATAQRPNIDGYKEDAEFALKVQELRYLKQQAEATERQSKKSNRVIVNNDEIVKMCKYTNNC